MEINGKRAGKDELLGMVAKQCSVHFTVPIGGANQEEWIIAVKQAYQGACFDVPLRIDMVWHTDNKPAMVNSRLRLALDAWEGVVYRSQRDQVRELVSKVKTDSPARLDVTITPLPPVDKIT